MAPSSSIIMAVGPANPSPNPLCGRVVGFTTPSAYSPRLSTLLHLRGALPLSVPTISVDPTPETILEFFNPNSNPNSDSDSDSDSVLDRFAGIAFTSRTGIRAFNLALALMESSSSSSSAPTFLSPSGPTFTLAALGNDADLLRHGLATKLCKNPARVRLLVPETATPAAMVDLLGFGSGRHILCPVPTVVGLTEPPVIPDFLKDLEAAGWIPVRVSAYETRWMGPKCIERLVALDKDLDAIVFTSTAEAEGLVMGLEELGWDWGTVRRRWPEMVVGAHGPVTAKGVEKYGIRVDVVSEKFSSFDGVLDALDLRWRCLGKK